MHIAWIVCLALGPSAVGGPLAAARPADAAAVPFEFHDAATYEGRSVLHFRNLDLRDKPDRPLAADFQPPRARVRDAAGRTLAKRPSRWRGSRQPRAVPPCGSMPTATAALRPTKNTPSPPSNWRSRCRSHGIETQGRDGQPHPHLPPLLAGRGPPLRRSRLRPGKPGICRRQAQGVDRRRQRRRAAEHHRPGPRAGGSRRRRSPRSGLGAISVG